MIDSDLEKFFQERLTKLIDQLKPKGSHAPGPKKPTLQDLDLDRPNPKPKPAK